MASSVLMLYFLPLCPFEKSMKRKKSTITDECMKNCVVQSVLSMLFSY